MRYRAFVGGVATAEVLGARATLVSAELGGVERRTSCAGDEIPIGDFHPDSRRANALRDELPISTVAGSTDELGPAAPFGLWPHADAPAQRLRARSAASA